MEGNLAVMLIDMQEGFLNHHSERSVCRMMKSQEYVLNNCIDNNIPVFTLEYNPWNFGKTNGFLRDKLNDVPRNFTFEKDKDDGFTNPNLLKELNELGISDLFFMGINKSFCVKATISSALENGFRALTSPHVIGDSKAISWRHEGNADYFYESNEIYFPNYFGLEDYFDKRDFFKKIKDFFV